MSVAGAARRVSTGARAAHRAADVVAAKRRRARSLLPTDAGHAGSSRLAEQKRTRRTPTLIERCEFSTRGSSKVSIYDGVSDFADESPTPARWPRARRADVPIPARQRRGDDHPSRRAVRCARRPLGRVGFRARNPRRARVHHRESAELADRCPAITTRTRLSTRTTSWSRRGRARAARRRTRRSSSRRAFASGIATRSLSRARPSSRRSRCATTTTRRACTSSSLRDSASRSRRTDFRLDVAPRQHRPERAAQPHARARMDVKRAARRRRRRG